MRYKKIIIGIAVTAFLICSGFMIYNVNSVFPNTDDKEYMTGDETRYKGLKLTVGETGVYTREEFIKKYPAGAENYGPIPEYTEEHNYVVAEIILENDTDETVSIGKFSTVTFWQIEADFNGNGMDYGKFMVLNPTYSLSFQSGTKQELILPFMIPEEWISYEKLKQSDIKIIYSFYPTKCYILYEGEEI